MQGTKLKDRVNKWLYEKINNIGTVNILEVHTNSIDTFWMKIISSPLYAGIRFLNPGQNCIVWSVKDFELRAEERLGKKWPHTYDESKFQEALDKMIDKHDAQYGISWITVDYWLDELCRKDDL